MVRRFVLAGALALALTLALAGCAGAGTQLTTQTPAQVTTFAEAEQAAALVTQAADTYVTTAHPDAAQLTQIGALSNGVHAALVKLEADRAAGRSLVLDSFNSALTAFNAFEASVVVGASATPAANQGGGS